MLSNRAEKLQDGYAIQDTSHVHQHNSNSEKRTLITSASRFVYLVTKKKKLFCAALIRNLIIFCCHCFSTEGPEGGVLIPFPSKLFFQISAQIPQSQPVLLKLKSHSHFLVFFFHKSQSQCTKFHFPASKKGKSQPPFYPFETLLTKYHIQYGVTAPVTLVGKVT